MDVRCEKCQTEYELDEARLKPSGVTVKCTNCGHMFKIRKRSTTNAGVAPADRSRTGTSRPPTVSGALRSAESVFGEETAVAVPKVDEAAVAGGGDKDKERQWLIRLENGEQKSCRELASLQQWIAAGIVTRESLISRTGKTWKRLGDIGELAQYFTVADESRAHRNTKQTGKTVANKPAPVDPRATMLGFSGGQAAQQATSAGGTILPDDDVDDDTDEQIEARNTGEFAGRAQQTPRPSSMPPPPGARTPATGSAVAPPPPPGKTNAPPLRTPPLGSPTTKAPPIPPRSPQSNASATLASLSPPAPGAAHGGPPTPPPGKSALGTSPTEMHLTPPPAPLPTPPVRRPLTTPPPPPPKRSEHTPPPVNPSMLGGPSSGTAPPPTGNRATAMWATDGIKPKGEGGDSKGPSGPRGGKLSAIPDEPAFAGSFSGRVRTEPTDSSVFSTGKIKLLDDDDDALPARRGSRAGTWIALIAIVVIGASAATIYAMMKRSDRVTAGVKLPPDAAVAALATDAAIGVTPIAPDAGSPAPAAPFAAQRAELLADVETRLLPALLAIQPQEDPPSLAMRAHLGAAVAQDLRDRAGLDADKADADKLRANADKVIVDAASLAPRALKAAPDDPTANLAMAEVLRLQKKPARDIKRYLDAARGKLDARSDPQLAREVALAEALVLARDGKLEDARSAFASIDQGDGKLETSGDVRARYHVALALLALDKPADAKPLVEQILAAQPEHAGARALAGKLSTTVASSDPLPPEDHRDAGVAVGPGSAVAVVGKDAGVAAGNDLGPGPAVPTGDYNKLVQQGNKLAESNCTEATKVFQRALDQNPAGADALTGIGYCQLDAKQFSSAYSKFSAALAVDPRNEGALSGIAEMYQQQGRKDKAVEAWKAYQAIYPGSPKAQKQIDRLNGAAPPPPPPETPPVTPTPTPTPTPAPEAGSDGT